MSHCHDHSHSHGCCSSSDHSSCCSDSCGCSDHHNHHESCDFPSILLALADEAWMEVLKEKIKDHIKQNDQKINQIAEVVAKANHEKWKHKLEKKKCCASYEEQLSSIFETCPSNKCHS